MVALKEEEETELVGEYGKDMEKGQEDDVEERGRGKEEEYL
jgi:hypothetical protein